MSTSVDKPLSAAESIFKSLIWNPAITAAESNAPFLKIWPFSAIVNMISNYIFSDLTEVVDIGAIVLLNDEHKTAYVSALEQLSVIAEEKGITSAEFKTAQASALSALSSFTRFNQ